MRAPILLWQRVQPVAGPSKLLRPPILSTILITPKSRSISSTASRESGHNKWSKIRHKKGAADAEKSKIWGRVSQDVVVAMRPPATSDPSTNPKLAELLAKAKDLGMPKATIDRAMARAQKAADGTGQTSMFEIMGPSGRDAYIVETLTDNLNRSTQRIREIVKKYRARISPVGFLFDKKGIIVVEPSKVETFDALFEAALEAGAEDVREIEGDEGLEWEVHTPVDRLSAISTALSEQFSVRSAEIAYIPSETVEASEEEEPASGEISLDATSQLVAAIEGDQDVVKVWSNVDGV